MSPSPRPVLFLPGWYPRPEDPQDGVFVRKHALAVSRYRPVIVLFPLPTTAGEAPEKTTSGKLTEYFPRWRPSRLPLLGRWISLWRYLQATARILRQIRRESPPALAHVHVLHRNGLFALWLHLRRGLPYLITEHWTGYLTGVYQRMPRLRRWMFQQIARRARLITVVSPSLAAAMQAAGLHNQYHIVPNVVESRLPEGTFSLPGKPGRVRLLNVSDFYDHKKNVSGLLRAVAALAEEGRELELHLVGDGPDRAALEELAAGRPALEGRLFFYGRLPNEAVLQLMAAVDVYVCPSHVETFSVTTAEALAAGKPVICTACGGPEHFVGPECGLVIPKDDPQALREALARMLKEYRRYDPQRLRAAARQFEAAAVGRQFEELYAQLPAGRQHKPEE